LQLPGFSSGGPCGRRCGRLIACLRRPAAPALAVLRSRHEIGLGRREILIDCVILVCMTTAYFAEEIDGCHQRREIEQKPLV
jgi:hypothetical protein